MSRAHSAVGKSPPGSHGQGEEAGNTGHRLACPRLGLTICTRAWRPASWPGPGEAAALPACRPACGQAEGWSFAQGLHAWVLTLGVTRSPRGQPLHGCACAHVCYGYSTSPGVRVRACRSEADYLWGCIQAWPWYGHAHLQDHDCTCAPIFALVTSV